jgi:glucose-6-phosphate dehydrogenase assembly protein OpcA
MIHAGERDASLWSSVVLPLLVPDLPVFLWWLDRPDSDLVKRGTQLVKLPEQTLSAFMNKDLTILGHDGIYERAIQFLI